jgi:uncharacterized membrane protein YheB (UPF0754 family)
MENNEVVYDQEKEKLGQIRMIAEKSAKSHLNKALSNKNLNLIIHDIAKNLENQIPDIQNYISCIDYKIDSSLEKGIINIKFHTDIILKHRIKDIKMIIS